MIAMDDATTEICPIHFWAMTAPTRTAIRGPNGCLDYRTLDRRLAGLCEQLSVAGLRPGDRLAATTCGTLEDVLLAWACIRSAIVFCPLNPAFPLSRQEAMAKRMKVVGFRSQDEVPDGRWQSLRLDFTREARVDDRLELSPNQPCNTILTSGSSGHPKVVLHCLGNHLASARGSASLIPLDPECSWLLSLPLFHVGGYAILFRVFLAGASLVLDERDRPLKTRLEQQPITHLSLIPTQLWRLLGEGFEPCHTQLRELLLGGAAIPSPLVAQLRERGLVAKVSYGLSEMASQVCTGVPSGPGVVGRPLPGREVKIEHGEILVRGETLFDGYDEGERIDPARDPEGWFHTSDKGYFIEGKELVVEGRLDNRFISGGENIQPEAIEQRLVDHFSVSQAIVVPIANQEWGQRPVAFIDWRAKPVPYATLEAWLRETLPGFMVPDYWLDWPYQDQSLKPSRQRLATLAQDATRSPR